MKRSEIFIRFAEAVCLACEVHFPNLLNGNKFQPVVDARTILIHELKKFGFSNHDIAVVSLRITHGNMHYDPHYIPDECQLKSKSKNIERQNRMYADQFDTNDLFRILAKNVSKEVERIADEIRLET